MFQIKNRFNDSVIYECELDEETKKLDHSKQLGFAVIKAVSDGVSLRYANLKYANLEYVYLRGAYLKSADLKGANLEGAILRGANLEGSNLRDAILRGANLEGSNLRGATFTGTGNKQYYQQIKELKTMNNFSKTRGKIIQTLVHIALMGFAVFEFLHGSNTSGILCLILMQLIGTSQRITDNNHGAV